MTIARKNSANEYPNNTTKDIRPAISANSRCSGLRTIFNHTPDRMMAATKLLINDNNEACANVLSTPKDSIMPKTFGGSSPYFAIDAFANAKMMTDCRRQKLTIGIVG